MLMGLTVLAVVNRSLTPDHLWVHWAALAWGAMFLVHLSVFSRETLATMFKRRASEGSGDHAEAPDRP
jgi:hypothetical protein